MSNRVGSEVQDLEFARQAERGFSSGSMDANYEPTHYLSEYGRGKVDCRKDSCREKSRGEEAVGDP